MARVKATTTDVHARLARGECANYRSGNCLGKNPCTVINGEACDYFASYVLPLLDYGEFSVKYAREAKITVALNPQSKVVHKRRQASISPTLAMEEAPKAAKEKPSAPLPVRTAPRVAASPKTLKPKMPPTTRREKTSLPTLSLEPVKLEKTPLPTPSPAAILAPQMEIPREVRLHDAPPSRREQAVTTVVSVSGDVLTKPRIEPERQVIIADQPQLLLELCPDEEPKRKSGRKR